MLVEEWIDNPNVTAVISAHYPGQESGDAITSVLFGDVSPSGKLPYTVAHSIEDYPPNTIVDEPVVNPQSNFTESTLIDYRWFSAHNITPRFEFGYGLSYSSFSYSNIDVMEVALPDNTTVQQTNEQFEGSDGTNSLYDVILAVTADVTNTGSVSASEVAQLVSPYGLIPWTVLPIRFSLGSTLLSQEARVSGYVGLTNSRGWRRVRRAQPCSSSAGRTSHCGARRDSYGMFQRVLSNCTLGQARQGCNWLVFFDVLEHLAHHRRSLGNFLVVDHIVTNHRESYHAPE